MSRREAIIGAIVILVLGFIFALIFAKPSCVSEISDEIVGLFRVLDDVETCEDGIDNDGDWFADVQDSQRSGYLSDEKCRALNTQGELPLQELETSARVNRPGGLIVLGSLRLFFPEGAVREEREVHIRRIPYRSPDIFSIKDVYDVTPDSLRLENPVRIELHIDPQDPNFSPYPSFFTEDQNGERLLVRASGYMQIGERGILVGYVREFSEKGAITWEEFATRYGLRPVGGSCFTSYRETTCPDADLCHGGLRGNVHCAACPIVPGGDFCCLCSSEFPTSDFPCGRDAAGNPLQQPIAGCAEHALDVSAETCSDIAAVLPRFADDENNKGAGIEAAIVPHISTADLEASISIVPGANSQFCTSIHLRGVQVDVPMRAFFPQWPQASSSRSCQEEWDKFLAQLRNHERRHAEIALEAAEWLREELQNSRFPVECFSDEGVARLRAKERIHERIRSKQNQAEAMKMENNRRFHEGSAPISLDCSQCP